MLMNRDRVRLMPVKLCEGLIHRATRGEIMNQIVFNATTRIWAQREGEREGHGKNHRGFMMSEPSCERAFPLTGKEILLQSVSLLTPACNRHKHAPP